MRRGQLLEQVLDYGATLRASGIRPGHVVNVVDTNTVWHDACGRTLELLKQQMSSVKPNL